MHIIYVFKGSCTLTCCNGFKGGRSQPSDMADAFQGPRNVIITVYQPWFDIFFQHRPISEIDLLTMEQNLKNVDMLT